MDGEERTKFGRVRVKNLPVLLPVTCCVLFLFFCVPVVGKGIIKNGDAR